MAKKLERPIGVIEKACLGALTLFTIAAWFADDVAWYQPILFFFFIGGLVVNISDYLHKRKNPAAATSPTPTQPPPSQPAPVARRAPRYSHELPAAHSNNLPDLKNKQTTADVVVCIHGLDDDTTERMERLCKVLGLSVALQASANVDMAVVGPDSAFDFAAANVPTYAADEFSDVLHRALDKFALQEGIATPPPRKPTPPATERWSILDDAAANTTRKPSTRPRAAAAPVMDADRITLPHTFSFNYRTSDGGNYGWREVNVSRVSAKGNHKYLEGYCFERMEVRTFRTDRIRGELRDMETGELIPVKRLLQEVRERSTMDYQPTERNTSGKDNQPTTVLFTGFAKARREALEAMAADAGWSVRVAIGPTLDYLVTGPRAGPTKVAKADELGVPAISEDEFKALV